MGDETLHAEHDVLARVNDTFDELAAAFRNAEAPLVARVDGIQAGAGELAGSLAHGATSFELSWRAVFRVCSATAGLVAGNVGRTSVDLRAVDIDASTTITL